MIDTSRIFNKSFNDLSFLQSNYDMNYRFAFVFDFDLTLTIKSSDGLKYGHNFIELFESKTKLERLIEYLKKINKLGNVVYINTRALIKDINHILKSSGIDIGSGKLIKEIKGSESIDNIENPFTKDELLKMSLKEINNSEILWAVKKVIFLNKINEVEKVPKSNILFFDDSSININTAKVNGYHNSFLIGSEDSGIIGLDFLLIKLQQIMDILYIEF